MKQNLSGLKKQKAEYETNADKVKGPAQILKNLYEERDNLLCKYNVCLLYLSFTLFSTTMPGSTLAVSQGTQDPEFQTDK